MNMEFWTLLLFSLVANAVARTIDVEQVRCATTCTESSRLGFVAGQVYTYQYQAGTSSRVSGTADQQTGGVDFDARVAISVLEKCHFSVTFESVESQLMTAENVQEIRESLTRHPLQVSWQDGRVAELCSHEEEDRWAVNIKKGFMSAMQNSFKGEQQIGYELDVSGDCETSYTRQTTGATITVRKVKDFNKCAGDRSKPYTAMLYTKYQADSTRKSLLYSTQDCNQTWSQEGVLQRTQCREQHLFRPFSYRGNGAETVITQNLELLNVRSSDDTEGTLLEREIRRSTLAFEEVRKTTEESARSSDSSRLTAALEDACDVINANAPSGNMPSAYLEVITEMKAVNKETLRLVWEEIVSGSICALQQEKIRQMFLDAVPMCDQQPCMDFAVDMISSDILSEEQKSMWITALSLVPKPTEKFIEIMLPLIRVDNARPESFLSLGTLLHRYCRDNRNCIRVPAVSDALEALQNLLGLNCHTPSKEQTRLIILALRAIGNAGITSATSTLNACTLESRNLPDVRIAAMTAFRRQSCSADRSSLRELLSDATEDSEIRISAYIALMRCPTFEVVRHVMEIMQTEEVNQVGSYIWNHVMEVGQSADPLKKYMRGMLHNSNLSDIFSKDKRKYSAYYERSLYSETLNLGAELDGDLVWSTTSFIPRSARLNMTVDVFGAAFNLFEIGARVQGLERQLERMFGPAAKDNAFISAILGMTDNDDNSRSKRSAVTKYDGKLGEIESRHSPMPQEEDPSASAYLRVFGNEMSFRTFGSEITETVESGSWFGGLRTLFNLATGTDYSFRHHRLLADSKIEVPTGAGLPLTLKVTGTTTMDLSIGGQIDLSRILFEGFNIAGHLKPSGAVEIMSTMSIDIGPITKAGIDMQSTLTTSMDVNGTLSLVDGQNFRLRVDVPQDQMDVVSYKSNLFLLQDNERTQIVPTAPQDGARWCTESGSQLLGLQLCTESSRTLTSNSADDVAPFFPLSGQVDYRFSISKTDPTLTHYLLETSYDWQQSSEAMVPEELSAHFFVGTPGSSVDRDTRLDLIFSATENSINCRLSTSQRSLHLQANRHITGTEKSGDVTLTIDEMQVYRMEGNMAYEKSRIGGHIWNGRAQIITPTTAGAPPSISGNFAYSNERQFEARLDITNIMQETIVIQVDGEKLEGDRARYNANGQVVIPGYLSADGQLRSTSKASSDRTHLSLNYALMGLPQHTVSLSHKYRTSSAADGEKWTITTDVSLSQFPSLNHKIQLQQETTDTGSDASLTVDYGSQYAEKSNERKFAIKQIITNQTTDAKTHLEGTWSVLVPEYDIDYRATLRHIFDWSSDSNKLLVLSGSFSKSRESKPLSAQLRATDRSSPTKLNVEAEAILSTPWGDIAVLQRLAQPEIGRLAAFGNLAFGQASGLQLQLVANVTNLDQSKGIQLHFYRPQPSQSVAETERQDIDDAAHIQPLPVAEDVVLFSTDWTTDSVWVPVGDYQISGKTVLQSRWNQRFTMNTTLSQETTGNAPRTLIVKRMDVEFSKGEKEISLYSNIETDNTNSNPFSSNTVSCRCHLTSRLEWTDIAQSRKHFELRGNYDRVLPADGTWNSADNRFDVSLHTTHNVNNIAPMIPTTFNLQAGMFARPVSESQSFSFEHIFGTTLNIDGPNAWNVMPVSFNQDIEVRFSDVTNMVLAYNLRGSSPLSISIWGINTPNRYELVNRLSIRASEGVMYSIDLSLDDAESLKTATTVRMETDRISFDAQWKQNLRRFQQFYNLAPRDVSLTAVLHKTADEATVTSTYTSLEHSTGMFDITGTIRFDEPSIHIMVDHSLAALTNVLSLPNNFQMTASTTSQTNALESSAMFEITTDGSNIATARISFSKPDLPEDPYKARIVLEHAIDTDVIPSNLESIAILFLNPGKKYGVGLQFAIGTSTFNSKISLDLPNSDQDLRMIVQHTHSVDSWRDAGFPSTFKLSLSISQDRDMAEFAYAVDETRVNVGIKFAQEPLAATNSIRRSLTVDISHNSQELLTTWNVPMRLKSILRGDDVADGSSKRKTTSFSWLINADDESIRTTLTIVRVMKSGMPTSMELMLSINNDMSVLRNILPANLELVGRIRKVHTGVTVRISRTEDGDQKHFEVTLYNQEFETDLPSSKSVLEISHSIPKLTEVLGLPQHILGSIRLEQLWCCFGSRMVANLEYDGDKSMRLETTVDCNKTAYTFAFDSLVNIPEALNAGVPSKFQSMVEVYLSRDDSAVGLISRMTIDENTEDFSVKMSADLDERSEDVYELQVEHTFEQLNALYNIPYRFVAIFTGRISGWNARGDVALTADRIRKYFRFNTGYRFDEESLVHYFDYAIRHNFISSDEYEEEAEASPTRMALSFRKDVSPFIAWDVSAFDERFKGQIGLDVAADGLKYDFTYLIRHTFDYLDDFVPKNEDVKLSVMLGSNNTVGIDVKVSYWYREFGLMAKATYRPADSTETLIFDWMSHHNYGRMREYVPRDIAITLTLARQGSNKMTFSIDTEIDEEKTQADMAVLKEAETYQYNTRTIVQLNRHSSKSAIFSSFVDNLDQYPTSARLSFAQPRDRRRAEINVQLTYPGSRAFHATVSAGQSNAETQDTDITLEISNNAKMVRKLGVPDAVHGTMNLRMETGDGSATIFATNLRTSGGNHLDVDMTMRMRQDNRVEVSYITSQNFAYLVETLGYPREIQSTSRLSFAEEQMSFRARILLDQESRFLQLVLYTPSSSTAEGELQLSRSMHFSHDFEAMYERYDIPKDFEVITEFTARHGGSSDLWSFVSNMEDCRASLTINLDQSAIVETSLLYRLINGEIDTTFALQHDVALLTDNGFARNHRARLQYEFESDNQQIELEMSRDGVSSNIIVRTTNQVIAADTKRAHREASFSMNHDINLLTDFLYIPTSLKLTTRRMLRKPLPSFEIGATLWVGHKKMDVTAEMNEAAFAGASSGVGYALRVAVMQDMDALLSLGVPSTLDITATGQPSPSGELGGTARITVNRGDEAVHSMLVTFMHESGDQITTSLRFAQDIPELININIPQELRASLAYSRGNNMLNAAFDGCYETQCIEMTSSYAFDRIANSVASSLEISQSISALQTIGIPSETSFDFKADITPNRASLQWKIKYGEEMMAMRTGMNVTLGTGEWSVGGSISHSWDILLTESGLPFSTSWEVSRKKSPHGRNTFSTAFNYGEKMLSTKLIITKTESPMIADFSIAITHNLYLLASMQIPTEFRSKVSLQKSKRGYQFNAGFDGNGFGFNATVGMSAAKNGNYDVRFENTHNMEDWLLSKNFALRLTAGSSGENGYAGEIRTTRGRKENTVSLTAENRVGAKGNNVGFITTMRQDISADLDETSFWSSLASRVEINLEANADVDNANFNLHSLIDDGVFDASLSRTRQSANEWSLSGSMTQSISWMQAFLPNHVTLTGGIEGIPNGYRSDIQLEYNDLRSSLQTSVVYSFNEDTRRNELVITFRHDVLEWTSKYQVPRQIRATLYNSKETEAVTQTMSVGILMQFDKHQAHLSLQGSLQQIALSDSQLRSSIRLYVDAGHDWPLLTEQYSIPEIARISLETLPLPNGMSAELVFSRNNIENQMTGSITFGWNEDEGRNEINLSLVHNSEELREMYNIPLNTQFSSFVQKRSGWSQLSGGWSFTADAKSVTQSVSYALQGFQTLQLALANKMINVMTPFTFLPSSVKLSAVIRLQGSSLSVNYQQTLESVMNTMEVGLTFFSTTTRGNRKELSLTINHDFPLLASQFLIPTESRIILTYHENADGHKTIHVDIRDGLNTGTASVVFVRSPERYRLTMESQHNIPLLAAIPEDIRISGQIHVSENSFSAAMDWILNESGSQRTGLTISWGVNDAENDRNELRLQYNHNFNVLMEKSVPQDNNILLFFSSPENGTFILGAEVNGDSYSAQATSNMKLHTLSKLSMSLSGHHNIPFLTQSGIPETGKIQIETSAQSNPISFGCTVRSSFDGVTTDLFSFKIDSNTLTGSASFDVEVDASHNITPLARWLPKTSRGQLRFALLDSREFTANLDIAVGEEIFKVYGHTNFNQTDSSLFYFESQLSLDHSLDWLTENGVPMSTSIDANLDFKMSSASIALNITNGNSATPSSLVFNLGYKTNGTTFSLSWNVTQNITYLMGLDIPEHVNEAFTITLTDVMMSSHYALQIDNSNAEFSLSVGPCLAGTQYTLKTQFDHSMEQLNNAGVPSSSNMKLFAALSQNQIEGFGFKGQFDTRKINGNMTWNTLNDDDDQPQFKCVFTLHHNIDDLERIMSIPTSLKSEFGGKLTSGNKMSLTSETRTTDAAKNFNLVVNYGKNNLEQGRDEIVVEFSHNSEALADLKIPFDVRICAHFLVSETLDSLVIGMRSNFDSSNLETSFTFSSPSSSRISIAAEMHHNIESLPIGMALNTTLWMQDPSTISMETRMTNDNMPSTPYVFESEIFFGKIEGSGRYEVRANFHHNRNEEELANVPSDIIISLYVDLTDKLNLTAGGYVTVNEVESLSINTGVSMLHDFKNIKAHVNSKQMLWENLPRAITSLTEMRVNTSASPQIISLTMDMERDGLSSHVQMLTSIDCEYPDVSLTIAISQNIPYLLDDLQIPGNIAGSMIVQTPKEDDLLFSIRFELSLDQKDPWMIEVNLDTNLHLKGSESYPFGRIDASFTLDHNIPILSEEIPNNIELSSHTTRTSETAVEFSFRHTLGLDSKHMTISISNHVVDNTGAKIDLRFRISHSIPDVTLPQALSLRFVGQRLTSGDGFTCRLDMTIDGETTKLGEIFVQRRFDSATKRDELNVTFQQNLSVLDQYSYLPQSLELTAFKSIEENVSVYSYDLTVSGTTSSCTLTMTPSSFDLTSEHDWVTLNLLTGLPYAIKLTGNWKGDLFPFKSYNFAYTGDLTKLESSLGLRSEGTGSLYLNADVTHNMRTWQILGLEMHNKLNIVIASNDKLAQVRVTATSKDAVLTSDWTISMEEGESCIYRVDVSSTHNMTILTRVYFPTAMEMHGELVLSPATTNDASLTITLEEESELQVRVTFNPQFQEWPQTSSLGITASATNSISSLVDVGVPRSMESTASFQHSSSSSTSASLSASANENVILSAMFSKHQGDALTFSIAFGDEYSIQFRDTASLTDTDSDGIGFDIEFASPGNDPFSFGIQINPEPLVDIALKMNPSTVIPEYIDEPVGMSVKVAQNDDGSYIAAIRANTGDRHIGLEISDIIYTVVTPNEWSMSYSLAFKNNITLLSDVIGLPSKYAMSESMSVGMSKQTLLHYELKVFTGEGNDATMTALVDVKDFSDSDFSLLTTMAVMHDLEQLRNILPPMFNVRSTYILKPSSQLGWKIATNNTFTASGDKMLQFNFGAGAVADTPSLESSKYLLEIGSSYKNFPALSDLLSFQSNDNKMYLKTTFTDVSSAAVGSARQFTMQKTLSVKTSFGGESGDMEAIVSRRATNDKFSNYEASMTASHDAVRLNDIGIPSSMSFEASSVAYSDSAKVDSLFSWVNSNSQEQIINATVQYDGGLPARVYGSHTLYLSCNHPFVLDLPSHSTMTANVDISDRHIISDWRIQYGGEDKFVLQKRIETTNLGVYEADLVFKQPIVDLLVTSLDITTSLTRQGRVNNAFGRAVINEADPVLLSGMVTRLDNTVSGRSGVDISLTMQPGIISRFVPQLNGPIIMEISQETTEEDISFSANGTFAEKVMSLSTSVSNRDDSYFTADINIQQPFTVTSRNLQLSGVVDARTRGRMENTFSVKSDMLEKEATLFTTFYRNYQNTMLGADVTLQRGDDSNENLLLAFALNNNSFDGATNCTMEMSVVQMSRNLLFKIAGQYSLSATMREVVAQFNHSVEEFAWQLEWNDDIALDRTQLSLSGPVIQTITVSTERTVDSLGTSRYQVALVLPEIIGMYSMVGIGDDTLTFGTGFTTDEVSPYPSITMVRNSDQSSLRIFDAGDSLTSPGDDLLLASVSSLSNGWTQLKLSSRRRGLNKLRSDMDHLRRAVSNYLGAVRAGSRTFSEQTGVTPYMPALMSFLDRLDSAFMQTLDRVQGVADSILNLQMPATLTGVNKQAQNIIESIGMPLDQLRSVYYESFLNQIKADTEQAIDYLMGSAGQTKAGWLVVNSVSEIINHNLDNLERKVFEMLMGSMPPANRVIHISDELVIISVPTLSSAKSLDTLPAAGIIRDWLAGTLVTKFVKDMLSYSLQDQYYRWLANWNAETTVPPFPGYATVIDNKHIVTFDGKLYDIQGSSCAHLLSHDFLDGNFSLIMQRTPEGVSSYLLKTKDSMGNPSSLQIHSDSTVTVNSAPVHLPFTNELATITRSHVQVTATLNSKAVILSCSTMNGFVCQLRLGAFYFGRIAGLMGSMDNEPSNDLLSVDGERGDNVEEAQETWEVASDGSTVTCPQSIMTSSRCDETNDVCEALFASADSSLRSCYPIVDPTPYLDACKRRSCEIGASCSLALAYRWSCASLGAVVSMPATCTTCSPRVTTVTAAAANNDTSFSSSSDTVFVLEGGLCANTLRETLPRLIRVMEDQPSDMERRYGLVVYGLSGVQIHTVTSDGHLFGGSHNIDKTLRRIAQDFSEVASAGSVALEAIRQAALYPFSDGSRKNVIVLTCSDCQETPQVKLTSVADLMNKLGVSFHLLRNEAISTVSDKAGRKSGKERVLGYDQSGVFTRKSIRGGELSSVPELINEINVPKSDMCSLILPRVADGSVWNAATMAARSRATGKSVTTAVAKRVTGIQARVDGGSLVAASLCRDCRCVTLTPDGLSRSACVPC